MEADYFYQQIINTYLETMSISITAKRLNTNKLRVRRVLITENLWSSPTSERIQELYQKKCSTKQIAEILCISEKNVQCYLPYTKGFYSQGAGSHTPERTLNFRKRKEIAANNQINKRKNSDFKNEQGVAVMEKYQGEKVALKLHLELNTEDLGEKEIQVLKKYGNFQNAISRDIIVPADITLHALHYVIQRLFGWQNGHLHRYELPEKMFNELTDNNVSKWFDLCGIYFRFPQEEYDDLFWDDDYEGKTCINTWLATKYKGPYIYYGTGDYYFENQKLVDEIKKNHPLLEIRPSFQEFLDNKGKENNKPKKVIPIEKATLHEFQNSIYLGGLVTSLIERIPISDILKSKNQNCTEIDLKPIISNLKNIYSENIDEWNIAINNTDTHITEFFELVGITTINNLIKAESLTYYYDFGDNWKVEITCEDEYFKDFLDNENAAHIEKVVKSHSPVCIDSDGINVFDDAGGIFGFVDFLNRLKTSDDPDEIKEWKEWASSLGWNGRKISNERRL